MTKEEICGNWLQRYTKVQLEEFGDLVLLTNFNNYVDMFCEQMNVTAVGFDYHGFALKRETSCRALLG